MKHFSSPGFSKTFVALFIILLIGAYLRLSHFEDLTRFNNDQVRDAKVLDTFFESGQFPLLGPKAGGTTFKLGPAYYGLSLVSGAVFGATPGGYALFIPLAAIATLALFFLLFQKIFPLHITLALTLLYALSFFAIKYARFGWNPNAVPFFLFAFLLLLLAERKYLVFSWQRSLALGLVIGISVQLHTTLLILLPVITLAWYGFLYFTKEKSVLKNFLVIVALAVMLQLPLFISDIQNKGQNIQSFFAGSQEKTSALSIPATANFFLTGTTYVLTGTEPTRSWENPIKLLQGRYWSSLLLLMATLLFFTFSLYAAVTSFRKEKDFEKKETLLLLFGTTALVTLLFLILGEEINTRFFSIIIFFPFLLLGFSLYALKEYLASDRMFLSILILITLALSITNITTYRAVYALTDPSVPESAYGGISYGETKNMARFIGEQTKMQNLGNEVFLLPFDRKRSLEYVLAKKDIKLSAINEDELGVESRFLIAENDKALKTFKKYECLFEKISEETTGRYTIFLMKPKPVAGSC